jgi:hypothetical protein
MKSLISIFLFFSILNIPTIAEIRKIYRNAASSEANAADFVLKLNGVTTNGDMTMVAYKGASIAIKAKFEKKISNKISGLKEGAKLIELAITTNPNDIEIRMIRLSIQENLPAVVKYKKNIKEDVAFIVKQYKTQANPLKEYLKTFILQSKSFSTEEKQNLK